jgi:predicted nucleic acid-binding protein
MSKPTLAIVDSSVYIPLFRSGKFAEELLEINKRYLIRNSAVVLLELFAGVSLKKERALVEQLERNFGVISPTPLNWSETGRVLCLLKQRHGFDSGRMRALVNDALIAISARDSGATVITANLKDFTMIQEIRPFDLIGLHGPRISGWNTETLRHRDRTRS